MGARGEGQRGLDPGPHLLLAHGQSPGADTDGGRAERSSLGGMGAADKAPDPGHLKGRAKKCDLQGSLHLAEPAPPGSQGAQRPTQEASRRPGTHTACRALDADVGIQPPLFAPLCVLSK
ncbi:unnamed protein product [Rangifer tarandus platyrhynchus]|uniref:Uncharacterized protein n=1 Tax=Rangifer tarandus platyrhynchus TaxID=3082113 RepID=A0AC59ZW43_RANTA